MKLSKEQKDEIVKTLKNSATFKKATTSAGLLHYLYQATLKEINLKESVIDYEFFGNNETNEKNNPRVRVNVYNLRKKINAYYEKEGQDEIWRLAIDKGQYRVRFYKEQKSFKKTNWKLVLPYSLLACILIISLFFSLPAKQPKIWNSLWNSSNPTHLFIGDLYGITGKTITTGQGWTRDFNINNSKEFYTFIDKNPNLKTKLKPSTYTYTTTMATLATQSLQRWYQTYEHHFTIHFTTKSSTSQIKEANAIYVGPLKDHNLFLPFFNEGNPFCYIDDKNLMITNHPTKPDITYSLNSFLETDEYAVVSKYPATGNTEHLVFLSQHDIGVTATVEYFTQKDSLKNFTQKYLTEKNYFTAIFRVKGQDRTSIDLKLIEVIPF
ncbi:hypothetical protein FHR24_002687 [Wenyingzhuangia heitensis]|uniref:Uncharacterized protein n=1 Tax=Wenyingzhuangia heitensis TaxID=1487859 RepID=A0ABX0UCU8_9FLAO|nr:hypothetical protein [Wenyingzhuangia heitensis]NIJ46203.1 hypothetical protein [Wenyingzhuangia heitensis]